MYKFHLYVITTCVPTRFLGPSTSTLSPTPGTSAGGPKPDPSAGGPRFYTGPYVCALPPGLRCRLPSPLALQLCIEIYGIVMSIN